MQPDNCHPLHAEEGVSATNGRDSNGRTCGARGEIPYTTHAFLVVPSNQGIDDAFGDIVAGLDDTRSSNSRGDGSPLSAQLEVPGLFAKATGDRAAATVPADTADTITTTRLSKHTDPSSRTPMISTQASPWALEPADRRRTHGAMSSSLADDCVPASVPQLERSLRETQRKFQHLLKRQRLATRGGSGAASLVGDEDAAHLLADMTRIAENLSMIADGFLHAAKDSNRRQQERHARAGPRRRPEPSASSCSSSDDIVTVHRSRSDAGSPFSFDNVHSGSDSDAESSPVRPQRSLETLKGPAPSSAAGAGRRLPLVSSEPSLMDGSLDPLNTTSAGSCGVLKRHQTLSPEQLGVGGNRPRLHKNNPSFHSALLRRPSVSTACSEHSTRIVVGNGLQSQSNSFRRHASSSYSPQSNGCLPTLGAGGVGSAGFGSTTDIGAHTMTTASSPCVSAMTTGVDMAMEPSSALASPRFEALDDDGGYGGLAHTAAAHKRKPHQQHQQQQQQQVLASVGSGAENVSDLSKPSASSAPPSAKTADLRGAAKSQSTSSGPQEFGSASVLFSQNAGPCPEYMQPPIFGAFGDFRSEGTVLPISAGLVAAAAATAIQTGNATHSGGLLELRSPTHFAEAFLGCSFAKGGASAVSLSGSGRVSSVLQASPSPGRMSEGGDSVVGRPTELELMTPAKRSATASPPPMPSAPRNCSRPPVFGKTTDITEDVGKKHHRRSPRKQSPQRQRHRPDHVDRYVPSRQHRPSYLEVPLALVKDVVKVEGATPSPSHSSASTPCASQAQNASLLNAHTWLQAVQEEGPLGPTADPTDARFRGISTISGVSSSDRDGSPERRLQQQQEQHGNPNGFPGSDAPTAAPPNVWQQQLALLEQLRRHHSRGAAGDAMARNVGTIGASDDGFDVLNQYTILDELGKGANGVVLLGFDTKAEKFYAVKKLNYSRVSWERKIEALKRSRLAARRNSGQIPPPPLSPAVSSVATPPVPRHGSPMGASVLSVSAVPLMHTSTLSAADRREHEQELDEADSLVSPQERIHPVEREIHHMRALHHPNIVELVEVIEDGDEDAIFLVMTHVPHGPLLRFEALDDASWSRLHDADFVTSINAATPSATSPAFTPTFHQTFAFPPPQSITGSGELPLFEVEVEDAHRGHRSVPPTDQLADTMEGSTSSSAHQHQKSHSAVGSASESTSGSGSGSGRHRPRVSTAVPMTQVPVFSSQHKEGPSDDDDHHPQPLIELGGIASLSASTEAFGPASSGSSSQRPARSGGPSQQRSATDRSPTSGALSKTFHSANLNKRMSTTACHDGDGYILLYRDASRLVCEPIRPLRKARCIAKQIVEAVYYMHVFRHMVHRDIKPDNILMDYGGEADTATGCANEQETIPDYIAGSTSSKRSIPNTLAYSQNRKWGRPYLTDFGETERFRSRKPLLPPIKIAGTPAFFAPEVCNGQESGPAADVWSLGVTLYAMIFGTLPFAGRSTRDIVEDISTGALGFPARPEAADDEEVETPADAARRASIRAFFDGDDDAPADISPSAQHAVATNTLRWWKDLLHRMLQKDPNSRPSIRWVLNHAVFQTAMGAELPANAPRGPYFATDASPSASSMGPATVAEMQVLQPLPLEGDHMLAIDADQSASISMLSSPERAAEAANEASQGSPLQYQRASNLSFNSASSAAVNAKASKYSRAWALDVGVADSSPDEGALAPPLNRSLDEDGGGTSTSVVPRDATRVTFFSKRVADQIRTRRASLIQGAADVQWRLRSPSHRSGGGVPFGVNAFDGSPRDPSMFTSPTSGIVALPPLPRRYSLQRDGALPPVSVADEANMTAFQIEAKRRRSQTFSERRRSNAIFTPPSGAGSPVRQLPPHRAGSHDAAAATNVGPATTAQRAPTDVDVISESGPVGREIRADSL